MEKASEGIQTVARKPVNRMLPFDMNENLPKEEQALELRKNRQGNCCQVVTAVLTQDPGLFQAASGFGGGMGNGRGPCGALVGAVMAAGKATQGQKTTGVSRRISERFQELSGSLICSELKGRDTGVMLCSCEDCIRNAIRAYEEVMNI